MSEYEKFLETKEIRAVATGIKSPVSINKKLFPFQADCVRWGLKRGCAAFFEDCGLGKTIQELEIAAQIHRATKRRVLILAPLAVSLQHCVEAERFGYDINLCAEDSDVRDGISITNYEKLHKFDTEQFEAVEIDESSIVKNFDGKTRNELIDRFKRTRFRYAMTATPAPNDYMELGNHAEFLGVMSRSEMLATFFVHDGGDTSKWRIKGHAQEEFWKWVCSWAVNLRKPSDLGYEDGNFKLPKLNVHEISVDSEQNLDGYLFAMPASSLMERKQARRESLSERVGAAADLANKSKEQWIMWCDLNSESTELTKKIKGAVEITGSDSDEHKLNSIKGFLSGKIRVLVTKGSIFGYGMNLQCCHNMAFVGMSDSWELYYQCVRRCWRFGQKFAVDVWIIISKLEGAVLANIKRKERDAMSMAESMASYMTEISKSEIKGMTKNILQYDAHHSMLVPEWIKDQS